MYYIVPVCTGTPVVTVLMHAIARIFYRQYQFLTTLVPVQILVGESMHAIARTFYRRNQVVNSVHCCTFEHVSHF